MSHQLVLPFPLAHYWHCNVQSSLELCQCCGYDSLQMSRPLQEPTLSDYLEVEGKEWEWLDWGSERQNWKPSYATRFRQGQCFSQIPRASYPNRGHSPGAMYIWIDSQCDNCMVHHAWINQWAPSRSSQWTFLLYRTLCSYLLSACYELESPHWHLSCCTFST